MVLNAPGVTRSHVHARLHRGADWRAARMNRTLASDDGLLAEIRLLVADLSSYDYTNVENSRHTRPDWPVFCPQKALIETS